MPIQITNPEFNLPKDLQKCHAELSDGVNAFNSDESALNSELEKLRSFTPGEVTREMLDASQAIAKRRTDLLAREFGIRSKLFDHWPRLEAERAKAYSASIEALGKAEADVLKRLLSIGYVETSLDTGRQCIVPGMIHVHPEVQAARNLKESLSGSMFSGIREQNSKRLFDIQCELERCRQSALAAK